MHGKLHSLTDVLKKTLFFFETLTPAELAPYVQQKMLQDYSPAKVEEKISFCLQQNPCFVQDKNGSWRLNLEGRRENDAFYALLLKRQQPLSLKEVIREAGGKHKEKKFKRLIAEEAGLISDGRFIQLENGFWGLTEWEVEAEQYALKHLVIKALKMHPAGLTAQQVFDVVRVWRQTALPEVENLLEKFPYFERIGNGVWVYNPVAQVAYENLLKRFLNVLGKQKARWQQDRERWQKRILVLEERLKEATTAHQEAAAALAQRVEEIGRHEQLVTQMAEKDLLLSLRKKEIFRYREHINKLEAKANSILHQCRLWVKRAREKEAENQQLREMISKNQDSLEALFTKLQQYKERDRENKAKITELKERHATKVAELQMEIVELRQKLEKSKNLAGQEERRLKEEVAALSGDLRNALKREEELERSLRFLQQDLTRCREEYRRLEAVLKNPLVKLTAKVCSLFSGGLKRAF
ncbi:MAG: phage-shock protein [Armatimonadetes bacterium]|nr:phage-shock protein [Armatimonadota bacterium]